MEYLIDRIPVLTNTVLLAGASKSIVVWSNSATAGASDSIVRMWGRVRNIVASGGAGRTLTTFTPSIELEPGAGYIDLATNAPAYGVNYNGAGVEGQTIDNWGRFTIGPYNDQITDPSYMPILDIASLKIGATAGAADVYLTIVLYVQRLAAQQRYSVTPIGTWG